MKRRDFLGLKGGSANAQVAESEGLRGLQSTLAPYQGAWGREEVIHLLKRTMFGAKWTDINYFSGKTMSQAVDELLTPTSASTSTPLNNYGSDPNVPDGQSWVLAPFDANVANVRTLSFKSWWMGEMINQDRSISQKMIFFWHNHFPTESQDINDARFSFKQIKLFRQFALGNFKQLVKAVTLDPAMLIYLNGRQNTKNAPDENYARELQELFTVGRDLANHYTEADVQAAAKVLSGYQIDDVNITNRFTSTRHDTTNKQFSSFYNNAVITGQTGANGANELDDLLTMIFNVEEVSKYICRKIYRYFVYYTIDATTEQDIILPMAAAFRQANYEIKPVLSLLFKSEHFFDVLNRGCIIKPGLELVISSLRELEVLQPPATGLPTQYSVWLVIQNYASLLGQNLGDPPNVAGWPAYYQTPQFHELWINSDSLPKRVSFPSALVQNGISRNGFTLKCNVLTLTRSFPTPSDPLALINDALAQFFRMDVDQSIKNVLLSILLSGQTQNYYWTDAWNLYLANTSNTANAMVVETRLKNFYLYLIQQAEYQLS
jgi:uncharacterized protein (DUF1800 family)